MKKIFSLFILISTLSTVNAFIFEIVILPREEVLTEYLKLIKINDVSITQNTSIVKKLANKELHSPLVCTIVDECLDALNLSPYVLAINRSLIIETILQDFPEAIQELKTFGLMA